MSQIIAYLTFNGNCKEAMTFYKESLGGELNLQTIEESPMSTVIPESMRQNILHSTLTKGNMVLMASDMVSERGLNNGNTVSLMLNCSSEEEIKKVYEALSEGGEATHPLENTFWGALFGDLTDKYGNQWLLNYSKTDEG
jgi:PhnB protein